MSMEKNGAISSNTPSGCCGGGCRQKQASEYIQLRLFPNSKEQADALDQDATKTAIDAVADKTSGK